MAAISFSALIASIPPVTRAFTAATITSTLVYAWLRWQYGLSYNPYLTLSPGSSVFYPWTFVTSGLMEINLIEVSWAWSSVPFTELHIPQFLITIASVPPSLRYFERLWGAVETVKFILICIVVPNFIAVIFNWLEFAVTRNAALFLYVSTLNHYFEAHALLDIYNIVVRWPYK
jgi:hypothetical protein